MHTDEMEMGELNLGVQENASAMLMAFTEKDAIPDPVFAVSLPKEEQLVAVYLLTLSNLAFVPTICLALYRRHFTLAAVFSYNCFFSTFYHACDASHVYQLCIMPYGVLAFCDFFASVVSFYTVLITMARIPEKLRTFLLVTGIMAIATCEDRNHLNVLSQVLPLVVAGVIMIISWTMQMYLRRRLFPSKRRYLCFLLPGVVLAVTGIGVNYGLMSHKSTYQYTHSFWHVALMTCPCFLMPPRPRRPLPAEEPADREPLLSESSCKVNYGSTEEGPPVSAQRQHPQLKDQEEPVMNDGSRSAGLPSHTRPITF